MQDDEIYDIVSRWYGLGHITEGEKAVLKAEYLRILGNPNRCTTCQAFWFDLLQYFRTHFKQINQPIMSAPKYQIKNNGYLQLPGQQELIVNQGVEEPGTRVILTEEMAEHIFDKHPDYAHMLEVNPAYGKDAEAIADVAAEGDDTTEAEKQADAEKIAALEGLQNTLIAARAKQEATDAELSKAKTANDTLQAEHDELKATHEQLQAEYDKLKAEHTATKGQLTKAKNKLEASTTDGQNENSGSTTPENPAAPAA